MWYYLPVVLIPAFIVIILSKFVFPHKVTWKEWLIQLGAGVVMTLICLALTYVGANMGSSDFSIFSGEVVGKKSEKVSCSHQYKCGETCRSVTSTDSNGRTSSRQVCEPVYCDEHPYDVSWRVLTTIGTWTIDRVDRQGKTMPQRWDDVIINEPVHEARYASNYLLLNPDRFTTSQQIQAKFAGKLFEYPYPYDYYRYYRVLSDNKQDYDDIAIWLNEKLKKDGPAHQLNILLVVTNNTDPDFYYAQMAKWRGVRKNEVVLFYGVDEDEKIQWSRAMSFADGQNNLIMLKELETMTYGRMFDATLVQEQYQKIIEEFQRVPNSTFRYLKDSWIPPTWWVISMSVFNLLVGLGLAWFMVKKDVA